MEPKREFLRKIACSGFTFCACAGTAAKLKVCGGEGTWGSEGGAFAVPSPPPFGILSGVLPISADPSRRVRSSASLQLVSLLTSVSYKKMTL